MLPDSQEVVKITPLPESLVITHSKNHGDYTCPNDGCTFSTQSPSMLGLHKAQAHNIKSSPKKGVLHQYFCPYSGCYYNPESGRFFKTLDILRTHYMKVHMEKKFKCSKCDKGFGLERDCLRHEKECGLIFACPDCGKTYNNKGALRMHCVSKGHKKPPELCQKPKTPSIKHTVHKKQQTPNKQQKPVPILPKFSPHDKVSLLCPPQTMTTTSPIQLPPTASIINQPKSFMTVMIQTNDLVSSQCQTDPLVYPSPVSIVHTPLGKKLCCDNVTQTIKPFPSQTKAKRHAPTQTQLSILEKAMKSSKIPIAKTSKATQKSIVSRKRKNTHKDDSGKKKYKPRSKLTVATLTDPQNYIFSQNIGSQTVFSIPYQNQQKSTEANTSAISTQTSVGNSFYQVGQEYVNSRNVSCIPQGASLDPTTSHLSDSITQTLDCFLSPVTTCLPNGSQTQKTFMQSSSSTTQTQESFALDSSTQTLNFDLENTSSFLDELFPESSGINVDTQTFGCFSSDMMTQTLEQLASDESQEIGTNAFGTQNVFVRNDMTQTFDEMVDSITQTLNPDICDCTTQTSLQTDIMTQTFDHLGIDIMTQTLNTITPMGLGCGEQTIRSQTYDNISQTEFPIFPKNDTATQSTIFDCNAMTQTDVSESDHTFSKDTQTFADILNLVTEDCNSSGSIDKQGIEILEDAIIQTIQPASTSISWSQTTNSSLSDSRVQMTQTTVSDVREMALQTENIDLWELSSQMPMDLARPNCDGLNLYRASSQFGNCIQQSSQHHSANPVSDSMTQTLSLPDESITLEAFLSDMATQTFDEDSFTFDALLQSSDQPLCDFATQTSKSPVHGASESSVLIDAGKKTTREQSSFYVSVENERENVWEIGTQTLDDIREMALQTDSEDLWNMSVQETQANLLGNNDHSLIDDNTLETATQTLVADEHDVIGTQQLGDNLWEMGTQTGGDNALAMGTQAAGDNAWGMGTQTGGDNAWEMGTQTGGDNAWEMGTQTGADNAWEMGTQTGGDDAWEMGTQTGGLNIWEMGTQTGGDIAWETGTQTGGDNAWEMGTQTGGDDAWETGTQTGGLNIWEMGTQTGGDNAWEMGTQTGGDNAWETGTQTVGDNAWEMGTQTRGDVAWKIGAQAGGDNAWEMGTQTGGVNIWEMGTQTMEGLLTDTMTQTGDDLIDFLLTSSNDTD